MLGAFVTSTLAVALAETGDKTQLLAIVLASKYKRPAPIILGVLGATLVCNFLASLAGATVAGLFQGFWFQLVIACTFLGMAAWSLRPEKEEDIENPKSSHGVFWTTFVCFLLAEMGDRTQLATLALAAQFHSIFVVGIGATLGMMIANVPAVLLGHKVTKVVPIHAIKIITSVVYFALGGWMLVEIILKMAHLYW